MPHDSGPASAMEHTVGYCCLSTPKPCLANAYHADRLRAACSLAYAARTILRVPDRRFAAAACIFFARLHAAFWHSREVNRNTLVNLPFGDANGFGHSHTISVNVERIQNRHRARAIAIAGSDA